MIHVMMMMMMMCVCVCVRGAEIGTKVRYDSLVKTIRWPSQCVNVQCTGSELSLAECSIHKPKLLNDTSEVAVANCYKEPAGDTPHYILNDSIHHFGFMM